MRYRNTTTLPKKGVEHDLIKVPIRVVKHKLNDIENKIKIL